MARAFARLTKRGRLSQHGSGLGMPGFTAYSSLREVAAGIVDGRIRYREDIVDHLENAPEAFIAMLDGRNFGKVIVRVAAEGGIYEQA